MRNKCGLAIAKVFVVFGLLVFGHRTSQAITIDLDFGGTGYFYGETTARPTIQQAATDVSAAITSTLAPIDQNVWARTIDPTGTATSGTYTWNFSYTIPATPQPIEISLTPNLPADTVKFFVRQENISGTTLGKGGSAGIGFSASYSAFPSDPNLQGEFAQLVDLQSTLAQDEYTRGAGPVISTIAGTSNLDFDVNDGFVDASWNYSVSYGPAYGTLAFDVDEDNDGAGDSPASLANYWHLDYRTPVAAGKNDLYSVAVHEILHALGVGSSETWNNLSSGTTWLGTEAIAEQGSGIGLVTGSHVASNTMSQRITDGQAQEVALDPSITVGQRKYLTTLDLAFLRDLGYSTITPSFGLPGDFNDDGVVDAADYTVWRDNLGAADESALNGNGSDTGGVDIADYSLWKSNFGMTAPASLASSRASAVPEPTSLVILLAGAIVFTPGARSFHRFA